MVDFILFEEVKLAQAAVIKQIINPVINRLWIILCLLTYLCLTIIPVLPEH
jgi:hypothetical protein